MTNNNPNSISSVGAVVSPGSGNGIDEILENSYGKTPRSLYPAPEGVVWTSPFMDNQVTGNELLWATVSALPNNQATQTLLQTKDMELWGLRKSDHKWQLLQTSNSHDTVWEDNTNPGFNGANYDFPTVTNQYGPLNLRINDGVASFNPGGNDAVEHWWPTNKPEDPSAHFNPHNFVGYIARADMRLEGADVNKASYVAQIGVDPHLGHGGYNKLTPDWETYSITTLNKDTLRNYPPPNKIPSDDSADKLLPGSERNDNLIGGSGNDTLVGGFGDDTLTGGGGRDTFLFYNPVKGVDTITDFQHHVDHILVKAAGFGGGLAAGDAITDEQFFSGTGVRAATNRDQLFIYNTSDDALYFDADGHGSAAHPRQIAVVPNMTFTDILVG